MKIFNLKKLVLITFISGTLNLPIHASIGEGITAFENNNFEFAKVMLLKEADDSFKKYLYLAQIAVKNNQLDEAEKYIEIAEKMNPKSDEVQYFYGMIMGLQAKESSIFSKMGYVNKMHEAFRAAVEISPEKVDYRRRLMGFHLMAPSLMGGDIDEALKQAFAIKKLDVLSGASALIQVYAKLEDHEKLENVFNNALKLFSNEPELFYRRGMYFQQQKDYVKALKDLHKAADMTTSTTRQYESKFNALYQIGRISVISEGHFDEGEKALKQYIEGTEVTSSMIEKDWAKYRLANIFEAKGDKKAAIALYKEIVKQTKNSDLKSKGEKRIKKLS
ncbi:tetratricopeptide repeat protein [Pseudoalteromonas denitrificans]|uniref:Tetratricopeptide repeat-containing protein n=1 Tax=Pseudoalteromonas denitrificans DSM 6059 TaxID=1123010 RepID=A0A1I1MWC7_9GAMM|nr:tetratricopeptide repeat protein [Pseudoalteromonas denitrificans]SFC89744.1 Tetratricopeptide repeat-containing protein [Pseudoalteromonas denitrificans DSM 6059]